MSGAVFKTSVKAEEVIEGQVPMPVSITVNDRAATREALIRKVRSRGRRFIERSEWKAKPPKGSLNDDWDYSMVALHHAGRSYSCAPGAEQMLDTQDSHLAGSYDDIAYHFGVDCEGVIYEGRDIRFKGSSVRNYNTGVIGVVLLNNFTTAEEGDDLVAVGRKTIEALGISTTNQIPGVQIDALLDLLTALKSVFVIKCFGGHREFPGQSSSGKICPGNIAMELVRNIRSKTRLLPPPTP